MEYGEMLDRVAVRARLSPEAADRVTRTVLRTLAEHLDAGEADDVAACLPAQLRGYLAKDRISAESFPPSEFVQRVALGAEVPRSGAENAVRGALSVLHEAVGDTEWTELMAQLPLEFRELAEAPGRGPRG
jgi:uncharacterized protein (DUF2267 family)